MCATTGLPRDERHNRNKVNLAPLGGLVDSVISRGEIPIRFGKRNAGQQK